MRAVRRRPPRLDAWAGQAAGGAVGFGPARGPVIFRPGNVFGADPHTRDGAFGFIGGNCALSGKTVIWGVDPKRTLWT